MTSAHDVRSQYLRSWAEPFRCQHAKHNECARDRARIDVIVHIKTVLFGTIATCVHIWTLQSKTATTLKVIGNETVT
jgi:hypothetical protein